MSDPQWPNIFDFWTVGQDMDKPSADIIQFVPKPNPNRQERPPVFDTFNHYHGESIDYSSLTQGEVDTTIPCAGSVPKDSA